MVGSTIQTVVTYALPLLLGVICHEVAHGWMAERLGDPTARMMGRITLNPIPHIDPIGTILVPLMLVIAQAPFLFGWAKPVPITYENLRGGRRDVTWVSLAGPVTNFLLAVAAATVWRFMLHGLAAGWFTGGPMAMVVEPVMLMARGAVIFNLVLMVVNLFPIPPLDGGHALMGLLPRPMAIQLARVERYGMLVVILLLATGLFGTIVSPILNVFYRILMP